MSAPSSPATPATSSMRLPALLETSAAIHAGVLLVGACWAFGGNIVWAKTVLSWFGSLGVLITLATVITRFRHERRSLRALHFLWPLLSYNALVLLSTLQPAFRSGIIYDAAVLVPISTLTAWPCSAQPDVTLRELWLFNALFFPAFNLFLCVRERRTLRRLLLVLVINALALAVFGTLQKLSSSPGLFFGAAASPNKTFFASFIYHNHWGAFIVLMTALTLGLLFQQRDRNASHTPRHSPILVGIVGVVVLAASAPLSTSRSATLLVSALLGAALLDGIRRVWRARSARPASRAATVAILVATGLMAVGTIYSLARPIITARVEDTRQQIAELREVGGLGSRAQLYHDTWRMAQARPAFGWGLGSFPVVFQLYNTQESSDRLPVLYVDAHSDWLESLAETGFTGTALLGLLVFFPVYSVLRHGSRTPPLAAYLLGGCALVLLYAWIEFPFGCPAVIAAFWICLFSAARLARTTARERPARV
jgi:O-antigen ligase